jgi:phage gp16-like protein
MTALAVDPAHRNKALAKIHVAKKQLAMEEDSYRALLRRITGKDSAKALEIVELDAVLAEFRRLGFSGAPDGKRKLRAAAHHPHVRKVFALWWSLKPYLNDGSSAALRSFVARQTRCDLTPDGVSSPDFLNPEQANKVTEGLKAWLKRERDKSKSVTVGDEGAVS